MHEDIQNKQTPFTVNDFDKVTKKRIAEIDDEFKRGFSFIKNYRKSVSFFGSARADSSSDNYKFAYKLARRISEELKYAIVTGGGPGIMEAGNKGAYDANGDSLGITIKLPNKQSTNIYVQKSEDFYYFFVRKVMLSFSAEAYIFFPGGFGTLDEFFEIMTLIQTHKIPPVPIILVGKEFWTPLEDYFKKYILEEHKAIEISDLKIYTITDDEEEIMKIVREAPMRKE